jgi:fructuronate reductase
MSWQTSVLHLGLGRFHRAHQAVYFQKLADLGDSRWGVTAFSMRSPGARDELRRLGMRYRVVEWAGTQRDEKQIESVRACGDAGADRPQWEATFCDPATRVVTLTVTEKGYTLDASGLLDERHADIVHDLAHPQAPRSAVGILVRGLALRHRAGASPLSIRSCDNQRDNGGKLSRAGRAFAALAGHHADVVGASAFPCTMVDRIVPAGVPGAPADEIATEHFSQWVVEDAFAGLRPEWERAGVEFVPDVRPYEDMKLRLLNAAHSLMAYHGLLADHRYVHEAVRDPAIRARVLRLWGEVTPLLELPAGHDTTAYCARLLERFDNPKLPHALAQIAADGSVKLPQRLWPTIEEARRRGTPHGETLAAWDAWVEFARAAVVEKRWEWQDPLLPKALGIPARQAEEWSVAFRALLPFQTR